jgi:hypothetical protein
MPMTQRESPALLFAQHFTTLPDPRRRLPQHPLLSILFIVLAAQLCGAEGWAAMAAFARAKQPWLASFLELPKGALSADTLRRVMGARGLRTVDTGQQFAESFEALHA